MNKIINICEEIDKYDDKCIYFCDPIKNNIINDGNFIRILYSKSFVLLNGIYLYFSLHLQSIEKYYNKLKCNFITGKHLDTIYKIRCLEEELLKKVSIKKTPQYKLSEQFNNGNLKIFNDTISNKNNDNNNKNNNKNNDNNNNDNAKNIDNKEKDKIIDTNERIFILKISGIWENELYYGLTFKFIKFDN